MMRLDQKHDRRFASRLVSNLDCANTQRLPEYWLTRCVLAASALHTSVYAQVGQMPALVLGALALLLLADVVVNDLMPENYRLDFVCHHRHTIYMAMALGLTGIGYVAAKDGDADALLTRLAIEATAATVVAFLDLYSRHRR